MGESLAKAILYPTTGLLWESEIEDPEISAANPTPRIMKMKATLASISWIALLAPSITRRRKPKLSTPAMYRKFDIFRARYTHRDLLFRFALTGTGDPGPHQALVGLPIPTPWFVP